jgi:hypothetical protein
LENGFARWMTEIKKWYWNNLLMPMKLKVWAVDRYVSWENQNSHWQVMPLYVADNNRVD